MLYLNKKAKPSEKSEFDFFIDTGKDKEGNFDFKFSAPPLRKVNLRFIRIIWKFPNQVKMALFAKICYNISEIIVI